MVIELSGWIRGRAGRTESSQSSLSFGVPDHDPVEMSTLTGYDEVIPNEDAMAHSQKRTFSLPVEHATFIDEQVASGSYASASEVVRAGLRALQERDAAVERWLRDDVAPVYDAMQAAPGRARSMEDVFGAIRARHARALADRS